MRQREIERVYFDKVRQGIKDVEMKGMCVCLWCICRYVSSYGVVEPLQQFHFVFWIIQLTVILDFHNVINNKVIFYNNIIHWNKHTQINSSSTISCHHKRFICTSCSYKSLLTFAVNSKIVLQWQKTDTSRALNMMLKLLTCHSIQFQTCKSIAWKTAKKQN